MSILFNVFVMLTLFEEGTYFKVNMPSDHQVARSVALEQAYVYDVYEQFSENPNSQAWPKVKQFLEELEPGSVICDVGCGSGKYLTMNSSIFNIGGERSERLSDIARDKDNEIIMLDNLALPFRDESLDAVLSIAVVHHFTTTERRIRALKELARIMRIGGRIIISVWAMEQSHRKFETQDVLVPWHRPHHLNTPSFELTSTTNTSEDDYLPPYHAYTQSDSDSCKSVSKKRGKHRHKGRSIDPGRNSSPSSSSLSSPNETCYSFVRRAIQKLAGARRTVQRPWFIDSWSTCNKEPSTRCLYPSKCECCDCEDIHNLPIELRRIDDEDVVSTRRQTFPSSQLISEISLNFKSRSLSDIKTIKNNNIVRSTTIVPNSNLVIHPVDVADANNYQGNLTKPKLVKQKHSVFDEDAEEALDKPTDMKSLIKSNEKPNLNDFIQNSRSKCMFKQRSLNEELMSSERLKEKENVKRNIQKQTSLNEELIFQRNRKLDSIKETIISVTTSKRLQLIREGLTHKLKSSTGIEKVTSSSLKNGFVRIFQNWKGTDLVSPVISENELYCSTSKISLIGNNEKCNSTPTGERRHSKEENSDSSKDSSLQSDTSVDSEDSFASVIFIPKTNPTSPIHVSPDSISPRLNVSVSNFSRIKQSSCPTSPRIKQVPLTVYPLKKQLSSPKSDFNFSKPDSDKVHHSSVNNEHKKIHENMNNDVNQMVIPKKIVTPLKYSVPPIPKFKKKSFIIDDNTEKFTEQDLPVLSLNQREERLKDNSKMLKLKPGLEIYSSKPKYPIVRHSSGTYGNFGSIARPLPKLLSLELFNPETDDKDSDSSAVSSPDSLESVVENQNKFSSSLIKFPFSQIKNIKQDSSNIKHNDKIITDASSINIMETSEKFINSVENSMCEINLVSSKSVTKQSQSADKLIVKRDTLNFNKNQKNNHFLPNMKPNWDDGCENRLTDFAEKLSEKYLNEVHSINCEKKVSNSSSNEDLCNPYISRLNEELEDITKLSAEIQEQNEYLCKFTVSDSCYISQCIRCKFEVCSCVSNYFDRKTCNRGLSQTKSKIKTNRKKIFNTHYLIKDKESKNKKQNWKNDVTGTTPSSENNSSSSTTLSKSLLKKGSSLESYDLKKGSSNYSISSSITTSLHFGKKDSDDNYYNGSNESNSIKSRCSDEDSTLSLTSSSEYNSINRNNFYKKLSKEKLVKNFFSANKVSSSLSQSLNNTSQESLPSDNFGGAITFHRYYHVFKEGELDQLIERHVQNLHIISSYYDHASWCIVAEKVQLWTI